MRQPLAERTRDLDELLRRRREDRRRWRPARCRRDPAPPAPRSAVRAHPLAIDDAKRTARRLDTEHDVLHDASGAARARVPDRSSPRRPRVPRADCAARRPAVEPHRTGVRLRAHRTGSPSTCSCPRRSGRRARTLRRPARRRSTPSSAIVAPKALQMPRISSARRRRPPLRVQPSLADPGAAAPARRGRPCDRARPAAHRCRCAVSTVSPWMCATIVLTPR